MLFKSKMKILMEEFSSEVIIYYDFVIYDIKFLGK